EGPPPWTPAEWAPASFFAELARSGVWGRYEGPHGGALKQALADSHGAAEVHLCSGGTAAVELALRGVGVQAGDEVILAGFDFKACAANVLALGALPVVVDLRPDDWQIDAAQLAAAFTPKTKAALVSHLHGGVVDMPAVRAVCDEVGAKVVEDICQAPGARIHGRPAGMWGDAAAMSFGGSKPLTAGRGGAVLTNEARIAARIRRHVWRGNDLSPLAEMQSALLLPQVERLPEDTATRLRSAEMLRALPGLAPLAPAATAGTTPAFYKMGFQYDLRAFDGLDRHRFCKAMRAEGVAFDPSFPTLRSTFSAKRVRFVGELPIAEDAGARCVVLHHPALLKGGADVAAIPAAVARIRQHAAEIADRVALSQADELLQW
ncbi:MAG: aminotransferase class V-fold PLP-dependent enzyme, partial [Planctomycetota bacterium]